MWDERVRAQIDWKKIARATAYYSHCGFSLIETPWRVTEEVAASTMPPDGRPFRCALDAERPGVLVGSAEQGFIAIMHDLKPGLYQSVSPCFRDESAESELKFRDFMKVELISVEPDDPERDSRVICRRAEHFFKRLGVVTDRVVTPIGVDLMVAGIEVGSYGFRTATIRGSRLTWAYGTGFAEPRASQAIAAYHKLH